MKAIVKYDDSKELYFVVYRRNILDKWAMLYKEIKKDPFDIIPFYFKGKKEAEVFAKSLTDEKIKRYHQEANTKFINELLK